MAWRSVRVALAMTACACPLFVGATVASVSGSQVASASTNATVALVVPLASTPSDRLPTLSGGNSVCYPGNVAFGAESANSG